MFTKNSYINTISLFLIGFIGFLFFFKYAAIYTGFSFLISTVYFILFVAVFYFVGQLASPTLRMFPFSGFAKSLFHKSEIFKILWVVVIILVFLIISFTPRAGEIGRYPSIIDWLDRFFRGDFPYNSPFTPSAFPFLFFIAYPFYLIGNAGYLEVIGLLIFALAAIHYSTNEKENLVRFLLLFATPVIYYSIMVRCELFTNMTLFIGLIFLLERYGDPRKINKIFFFFALLFGLALSTRSVAGLIYAIYSLYYFKNNIQNLLLFSIIVLAVFILTLIPFVLWDRESFLNNGPFAIQSFLSYLPMWIVVLLLLISIYTGWRVSDLQEVFFACGVMMFIPVFISMMIKIFESGFYNSVINDIFDLSYYEFALPFLIFSVKDYKVDRFLKRL